MNITLMRGKHISVKGSKVSKNSLRSSGSGGCMLPAASQVRIASRVSGKLLESRASKEAQQSGGSG
jgi:hypothetical protein